MQDTLKPGHSFRGRSPIDSHGSCSVAHEAEIARHPGYEITQIFRVVRTIGDFCRPSGSLPVLVPGELTEYRYKCSLAALLDSDSDSETSHFMAVVTETHPLFYSSLTMLAYGRKYFKAPSASRGDGFFTVCPLRKLTSQLGALPGGLVALTNIANCH